MRYRYTEVSEQNQRRRRRRIASPFKAVDRAEDTGSSQDFRAAYSRLQSTRYNAKFPPQTVQILEQRLARLAIQNDVHTAMIVGLSQDVLRSPFYPMPQTLPERFAGARVVMQNRHAAGLRYGNDLLYGDIASLCLYHTPASELFDAATKPAELFFSHYEGNAALSYRRKIPLKTTVHEHYSDNLRRVSVDVNALGVRLLDDATRIRLSEIALSICEGGNLADTIFEMPPASMRPIEVCELPPYDAAVRQIGGEA